MADQAETLQGFTAEDLRKAGVILGSMAFVSAGRDDELREGLMATFEKVAEQTSDPAMQAIWTTEWCEAAGIVADAAALTMWSVPGIIARADARGELPV